MQCYVKLQIFFGKDMKYLVVAAAVVFAGFGASATASVMQAVYTGTVYNSQNDTGEFGIADPHGLDGLAYTLTYVYDTSLGHRTTNSQHDDVIGGTYYNAVSPIVSSLLTINGVTKLVLGGYTGEVAVYNYSYEMSFSLDASDFYSSGDFGSANHIGMSSFVPKGSIQTNVERAFSLGSLANNFSSFFQFQTYNNSTSSFSTNVKGDLSQESLIVTRISPVPLPASFGLMAAALGGLVAFRRRRGHRAV